MNIIAIDVACEVSRICAIRKSGKMIFEGNIETTALALKEAVKKIPSPRQIVFEECTQANWLWSVLEPLAEDVLICDPRQNRELSGYKKSDRIDALKLCERARLGALKRVWHGGEGIQSLRHAVYLYESLTAESTRLKNQIKSVFRARGIRIGQKAYDKQERKQSLLTLPTDAMRSRVSGLGVVLDVVTVQRTKALRELIALARKQKGYQALRTIDGVGPIFAAYIMAVIGDPHRFRTKRQLWAYVGLAVESYESGEFTVVNGRIRRKDRPAQTRGLTRSYNRTLKYVFKQIAMTLSRTTWRSYHATLMERSRNGNNVQLTIARKIAGIVLHVFKTGERYEVAKAFKKQ